MDKARELAEAGAAHGTVIWAKRQTAGRGRQGRTWVSPMGNCYSTVIFHLKASPSEAAKLSFAVALAVADTVTLQLPPSLSHKITCKWPNDVLVEGAKISGILLETRSGREGQIAWLLAGVGINLATKPVGMAYPATSLNELGATSTVPAVLECYLARLAHWLSLWRTQGFAPVRQAWRERAWGLGETISVRVTHGELQGIFEDLDETGALILRLENGDAKMITAGDVFLAGS